MSKLGFALKLLLCLAVVAGIAYAVYEAVGLYPWLTFEPGLKTLLLEPVDDITALFPEQAQIVTVVYGRTDCAACQEEIKALSEMNDLAGRAVAIWVDVGQSWFSVNSFLDKENIIASGNFPVLLGGTQEMMQRDYAKGAEADKLVESYESLPVPLNIYWLKVEGEWKIIYAAVGSQPAENIANINYNMLIYYDLIPVSEVEQTLIAGELPSGVVPFLQQGWGSAEFTWMLIRHGYTMESPELFGGLMNNGDIYIEGTNGNKLILVDWGFIGNRQLMILYYDGPINIEVDDVYTLLYDLTQLALLADDYGLIEDDDWDVLYVLTISDSPSIKRPIMSMLNIIERDNIANYPYPRPDTDEEMYNVVAERWYALSASDYLSLTWGLYPYYFGTESALSFIFVKEAALEDNVELADSFNQQIAWIMSDPKDWPAHPFP